MFKVIHGFYDLKDDRYHYQVGDKYPRKGRTTKKRVAELKGDNVHNIAFIEEVEVE